MFTNTTVTYKWRNTTVSDL